MTDFRQHFLTESINNLRNLQTRLAEEFDASLRSEIFRTIHTIKGGAQVFGLKETARLAEELENILSQNEPQGDKNLLFESIARLADSMRQSETNPPAVFTEKLNPANQAPPRSDVLFTQIPAQAFKNFSQTERNATVSALREGKNIYCAEVLFESSRFAADYRNLRKVLSEKSEIIASMPSEKYKSSGNIGFRIFLASRETAGNLQKSAADFNIEISSHACLEKAPGDLFKMLSQVAAHAENIAENSGKEIRLTILSNEAELSAELTKTFFDILLHLVRNAADHAIEKRGVIEIRFFDEPEGFYLSVADDGCGIDLSKTRARAVAKNLISDDDFLDEQETLRLIFAPGLSTAEASSEISGRGVGLDAVKSAVEKMSGKISVRNRKTNGAIFEIFVPHEKI